MNQLFAVLCWLLIKGLDVLVIWTIVGMFLAPYYQTLTFIGHDESITLHYGFWKGFVVDQLIANYHTAINWLRVEHWIDYRTHKVKVGTFHIVVLNQLLALMFAGFGWVVYGLFWPIFPLNYLFGDLDLSADR